MDALMDYVLDDSSDDASALWLEAWSLGRRNAPLAAEAKELTAEWLDVHRRHRAGGRRRRRVPRWPTSTSRRGGC